MIINFAVFLNKHGSKVITRIIKILHRLEQYILFSVITNPKGNSLTENY